MEIYRSGMFKLSFSPAMQRYLKAVSYTHLDVYKRQLVERDMLEKYCEKQGWEVVAVYQDDGFTGLNMELSLVHICCNFAENRPETIH